MKYAPKTKFIKKSIIKKFAAVLAFIICFFTVGSGCYIGYLIKSIPDEITLYKNSKHNFDRTGIFSELFSLDVQAGTDGVLYEDGTLETEGTNQYTAQVSFLSGIKLKQVKVNAVSEAYLIPAGNLIGVKIFCPGALVTDICTFPSTEGINFCPAEYTGIKCGDLITKINNKDITTVEQLKNIIKDVDGQIFLTLKRDEKFYDCAITPKPDKSGTMRLGLMVKDSAAGIGTMTYYNPKDSSFGALGHAVCDPQTDKTLPILEGSCDYASVANIIKGQKGIPGEMHGMFLSPMGDITKNTENGIYGYVTDNTFSNNKTPVAAASMNEVAPGKATIISTVDESTPKEFEIEIEKVSTMSLDSSKGMVIKITDSTLLAKTGGIIQGMSGSPILQNGKLIGAVTHVFVNDPTRGYGIFIENMLENTD